MTLNGFFSLRRVPHGYRWWLLVAGVLGGLVHAHGLLVSARVEHGAIVGTAYYSDGTRAAGEFVELIDLDQPGAPPRETTTVEGGLFRFEGGIPGHRYRVIAHGDEGHMTEMALVFEEGSRALLDEPGQEETSGVPAWLALGGLLLASAVPAVWLRLTQRERRRTPAPTQPDHQPEP